ncbi:MAG TPA: hypothetical protein PKV22_03380 [Paludibacteraceae bacterium]|nr:hypothetical protein [Paludibacteraceae bacterium]
MRIRCVRELNPFFDLKSLCLSVLPDSFKFTDGVTWTQNDRQFLNCAIKKEIEMKKSEVEEYHNPCTA